MITVMAKRGLSAGIIPAKSATIEVSRPSLPATSAVPVFAAMRYPLTFTTLLYPSATDSMAFLTWSATDSSMTRVEEPSCGVSIVPSAWVTDLISDCCLRTPLLPMVATTLVSWSAFTEYP